MEPDVDEALPPRAALNSAQLQFYELLSSLGINDAAPYDKSKFLASWFANKEKLLIAPALNDKDIYPWNGAPQSFTSREWKLILDWQKKHEGLFCSLV